MNELVTLKSLALEINNYHRSALHHSEQAVVYAAHCGQKLLEAKAACQHGEWLQWLKVNCAVRKAQANKYMRLAREMPELIDSKKQSSVFLPGIDAAIALLSAPDEIKEEFKEAVAEGKTSRKQRSKPQSMKRKRKRTNALGIGASKR